MSRALRAALAVLFILSLQPAVWRLAPSAQAAATGSITGRVTSAAQPGGVRDVLVYSYDLEHCVADIAWTDSGGRYTLDNMETAGFVVRFETRLTSRAYLDQWYAGKASFPEATPVQVTDGQVSPGIDVVLQEGTDTRLRAAVISGSETDNYSYASDIAGYLESEGFEVEWMLSGDTQGAERSDVDPRVVEEGLSGAKVVYYTGHGIYYGALPDCRVGGLYAFGRFFGYETFSRLDFAENPVMLFAHACFTAGDHSVSVATPSTDEDKKSFIAMYANDFMGWQRGSYYDYSSWQTDYAQRNLGFALYYADNYYGGTLDFLERLLSGQDYRLDELIDEAYVEDPFRYNDENDPANPMQGDYRMLLPGDIGSIALVGNLDLTTSEIFSGGSAPTPGPAPGVPAGYDSVFYFAEGYTGNDFREYLTLGNPAPKAAGVQVLYMFPDGSWQVGSLTVPPASRSTVDVNAVVGRDREVSVRIASDQAIVAERPMYFFKGGGGGSTVLGATSPSGTWYFAEGYTGSGFEEYICVLNPGGQTAALTFYFQTQEAGEIVKTGFSVPAHSRATFCVNDILGGAYQNSLKLVASRPVVAERPMYFDYQGTRHYGWSGGHCVMGATSLAGSYYFAEGTTRSNFEEWLTLQNPNPVPITVEAVYQLGPGQGNPVSKTYTIGPASRSTVFVPEETGWEKDVSVRLVSSSSFLAERPTYFNYDYAWTGGHCVIGSPDTGTEWYFAEGYTGDGFHEWLSLQNPGDAEAVVEVTYYTQEAGALPAREVRVPARTRTTIRVNDHAGPGYQLSTRLRVVSGPGIVAERPMYFLYNGTWEGGHDVMGCRQ